MDHASFEVGFWLRLGSMFTGDFPEVALRAWLVSQANLHIASWEKELEVMTQKRDSQGPERVPFSVGIIFKEDHEF